jgi:hypothetical protein
LSGHTPDQELLPGYHSSSSMCRYQFRTGPFACHSATRDGPSGLSRTRLVGLPSPTHAGRLIRRAIGSVIVEEAPAVVPSGRRLHQMRPAGPTAREYGEGAR